MTDEDTQFCMLPMYPPSTSAARHAGLYSSSMRVLNLNKTGKSSTKAQALIANPLVSRILIKRSNIKRATAADRRHKPLFARSRRRYAGVSTPAPDSKGLQTFTNYENRLEKDAYM